MKEKIYLLILTIDKIFIYIQYFYLQLFKKEKYSYKFFHGGWGYLVKGLFSLNYTKKKYKKKLVILDLKILNQSIEKCLINIEIYKIYSIFKLLNLTFDQYPKEFKDKIKNYSSNIFDEYNDLNSLLFDKSDQDKIYYKREILSDYVKSEISKEPRYAHFFNSLNDQTYKIGKKKFFNLKNKYLETFENIIGFKKKILEKKSINICIRLRNKNYKLDSKRSNTLRDGNLESYRYIINFLLRNHNYILFITGDCDQINIKHKNLIYYDKIKDKITRDFFQIGIQSISRYHIMNLGGANQIMKYNKCKFLYIDCWPPMTLSVNSVLLYKNISFKNKRVKINKYVLDYFKNLKKGSKVDPFKTSKIIYEKFLEAKKYLITKNSKEQILISLKEFMHLIKEDQSDKYFKNRLFYMFPKMYKKVLLKNRCLLSSGNLINK